jgi:hypothetical protein
MPSPDSDPVVLHKNATVRVVFRSSPLLSESKLLWRLRNAARDEARMKMGHSFALDAAEQATMAEPPGGCKRAKCVQGVANRNRIASKGSTAVEKLKQMVVDLKAESKAKAVVHKQALAGQHSALKGQLSTAKASLKTTGKKHAGEIKDLRDRLALLDGSLASERTQAATHHAEINRLTAALAPLALRRPTTPLAVVPSSSSTTGAADSGARRLPSTRLR